MLRNVTRRILNIFPPLAMPLLPLSGFSHLSSSVAEGTIKSFWGFLVCSSGAMTKNGCLATHMTDDRGFSVALRRNCRFLLAGVQNGSDFVNQLLLQAVGVDGTGNIYSCVLWKNVAESLAYDEHCLMLCQLNLLEFTRRPPRLSNSIIFHAHKSNN